MTDGRATERNVDKINKLIAEIEKEATKIHDTEERLELAKEFTEELKNIMVEDHEPFKKFHKVYEKIDLSCRNNRRVERKTCKRIVILNFGVLFIYLAGISVGSSESNSNAGHVFGVSIHNLQFSDVAAAYLFFLFFSYITWLWRILRDFTLTAGVSLQAFEISNVRKQKYDEVTAAIDEFTHMDPDTPDQVQKEIIEAYSKEIKSLDKSKKWVEELEYWPLTIACICSTNICFYYVPDFVEPPFNIAAHVMEQGVYAANVLLVAVFGWLRWKRKP